MARGWFDQSAGTFNPAERTSYLMNKVKADTSSVGYSPKQEGYLTILGKTLQGIAAPFAGDYQFNQRQAEQDLRQQQADMEFAALLEKNRMINEENRNQNELRSAQTNQLNALAEYYRSQPQGQSGLGDYPYPEDIQQTPKTYSYKGVTKTTFVPQLKSPVSQSQLADISGLEATMSDLEKNMQTLNKYNIKSGPSYETSQLPLADVYSQLTKSKEFNTWKADTGRAFQKYRKWATGVAAGYPELQLLAPTFPKASDTPENFIAKSISAKEDMRRNKDMLLKHLSQAGYRTGELRGSKAKEEQPVNTQGWNDTKAARLEELRKKLGK